MDAPASGHGLGMLRSPRTFGDIARVGPIRRRADVIHRFLTDARSTGVVAEELPHEMPRNQTGEVRLKLKNEKGVDTHPGVVNTPLPGRVSTGAGEGREGLDGDHRAPPGG